MAPWLQSPSTVILEPKKIKYAVVFSFSPSVCYEVMGLDAMILKSAAVFSFSPSVCYEVMGLDAMILVFWILSFKPAFLLSFSTLIKKLFSSSLLFAIRGVSSACFRFLMFPPAVLIPACESSSLAFLMIYPACKLNKQSDNIQPWWTPFSILNQSVVPCPVLTVAPCCCCYVNSVVSNSVWPLDLHTNLPTSLRR